MKTNKLPSTKELFSMYSKTNRDCAETGETVAPFYDTKYYGERLAIDFEDLDLSDKVICQEVKKLSEYAEKENTQYVFRLMPGNDAFVTYFHGDGGHTTKIYLPHLDIIAKHAEEARQMGELMLPMEDNHICKDIEIKNQF